VQGVLSTQLGNTRRLPNVVGMGGERKTGVGHSFLGCWVNIFRLGKRGIVWHDCHQSAPVMSPSEDF